MSMPVYCLEMRSTANWNDVRYREYTTSVRKAEAFKKIYQKFSSQIAAMA